MIDPSHLHDHIENHRPWLFHATRIEDIESILKQGIRPGSELDRHNSEGFHRTRRGHVYMSKLDHCRRLQDASELPEGTIRVDLRKLDPCRIDPDEDMVQHAYLGIGMEAEQWVDIAPPEKGDRWKEGPNGEGTLWYWAEHTRDFDAPDVTAKSLAHGRVSYCGTVPPEALSDPGRA